jgi:hemerythrin-like metal-binding protein
MLTWSEEFATGSAVIDLQHKTLIERINEIERLLDGPPPAKAACEDLLKFLRAYAGSHFTYEEQCMEKARCPAHVKNKQAHAAFLGIFSEFEEMCQTEGPKAELLRGLHTTASDWIKNHILSIDVRMRPHCAPAIPAGSA